MEYIGWCIDEYQFYLKRATIELANYLSKYNRIKKDIQKDIILEFGIQKNEKFNGYRFL